MDGARFDAWAKGVAARGGSRRGLLRGLGAVALAAALGAWAAGGAVACTKDGKSCNPKKPEECCSGRCTKHKHGDATCTKAKGAKGCTVDDDNCRAVDHVPLACPANPDGVCVVLDNGRPFCAVEYACAECATGADCDALFGASGGRCVTDCPACVAAGTACVFAEVVS